MTQPCNLDNRITRPGDRPFPQPAELQPLEDRLRYLDRSVADLEECQEELNLKLRRLAAVAEYAILTPGFGDLAEPSGAGAGDRGADGRASASRAWRPGLRLSACSSVAPWTTCSSKLARPTKSTGRPPCQQRWRRSPRCTAMTSCGQDPTCSVSLTPPAAWAPPMAAKLTGPWVQSPRLRRAGRDHDALQQVLVTVNSRRRLVTRRDLLARGASRPAGGLRRRPADPAADPGLERQSSAICTRGSALTARVLASPPPPPGVLARRGCQHLPGGRARTSISPRQRRTWRCC